MKVLLNIVCFTFERDGLFLYPKIRRLNRVQSYNISPYYNKVIRIIKK